MEDRLGRKYKKGGHGYPRPEHIRGVTNEQRSVRAKKRQEDIKKLSDGPIKFTPSQLAKMFNVSVSTINTDLRLIGTYNNSGKGDYYTHNRSKLGYIEYQCKCIIKTHPGATLDSIIEIHKKEMFGEATKKSIKYHVARLKTLGHIKERDGEFFYNVARELVPYVYRGIVGQTNGEKCKNRTISTAKHYSNPIGKGATGISTLVRSEPLNSLRLPLSFNRTCRELNKNGAPCGGTIVRGNDYVFYCSNCGMTQYDSMFATGESELKEDNMIETDKYLLGKTAPLEFLRTLRCKNGEVFGKP